MRLLVDLQPLQGPSARRGIGYYALSLTRALAAARPPGDVRVLLDGTAPAEELLRVRHALRGAVGRDDVVVYESTPGQLERQVAREAAIAALAPDVVLLSSVFELAPGAPMTVGRWCAELPTAAVLYDLIPLTDLDAYKGDPVDREEYLAGLRELTRTDLLLSISEHSAAEARARLADCPPVVTVHGAAPVPATPRTPRWAPTGGFALAVGSFEPRKDVATAVLAWARLPAEVRRGRPFVAVGYWPPEHVLEVTQRAEAAGLRSHELLFPGQVDDHEMAWAYAHADVFVFPSLLEGLGLPPLEAMHAGTPALMSASSSLLELLDDDRAYFPPGDVAALTERLRAVLTDEDLRAELVAAGHRSVQHFTWQRTASVAWSALEGLVRPPSPAPALRAAHVHAGGGAVDLSAYRTDDVDVRRGADWPQPWWRYDRVVHELSATESWTVLDEHLADTPGAVVVPHAAPEHVDVATALAPATGVLVPDLEACSALLRAGVTSVPVHVVDLADAAAVHAAVERTCRQDTGAHWARGAASADVDLDGGAAQEPPRWAARGDRGALLASDVTVYRTTSFMSGIQRTVARLHAALGPTLQARGGALVPLQLGTSPDGTPHPDIRADEVARGVDVDPRHADWLLCLDLNGQLAVQAALLQDARARGAGVVVNVFDLIPWTHPEWFPRGAADTSFTPWLRRATSVADVLLVNSVATARALATFVQQLPPDRVDAFVVHHLPLGCDFDAAPDAVVPPERDTAHFLMVGTVEPRKGHRAVLDAFERLWADGSTARLTVLGRSGWMVDDLVSRMDALCDTQPAFAWLQHASDADLDALYRTCTAAVVASEDEGFGLPVVEAALRDCPVIVRDIPVLREIAGDDATYFDAARPLDDVLRRAIAGEPVRRVARDGLLSWQQVGARLLDVLDGRPEPLARWSPEDGWQWS